MIGGIPTVSYCCIQGWTGALGGTGNHGRDPMFADPDGEDDICGTEDDNLQLLPGSACIDAGSNFLVPLDTMDLDRDGDEQERVPLDLAGQPRFADDPATVDVGSGAQPVVDIGAYERSPGEAGPGPGPVGGLVVRFGGTYFPLDPDPDAPSASHTFIGSGTIELDLNFEATLSVTVAPTSSAGGTWTGWVDPDEAVGPGTVTMTIWVKGENLDLAALPAGGQTVEVAEVTLLMVFIP